MCEALIAACNEMKESAVKVYSIPLAQRGPRSIDEAWKTVANNYDRDFVDRNYIALQSAFDTGMHEGKAKQSMS